MADLETRTEQATPRRREKHRDEGKVAMSRDLLSFAVLAGAAIGLVLVLDRASQQLSAATRVVLGDLDGVHRGTSSSHTGTLLSTAAMVLLPVGLLGSLGALGAGFAQTRGLFSAKAMKFDLSRLEPLQRLQQMLASKDAVLALLQASGKVAIIIAVTWQLFVEELGALVTAGHCPVPEILRLLASSTGRLGLRVILVLGLLAAVDYLLVHRRLAQQMKMSKQEVKDEHREHDGDPAVKQRQRARAREILRQRMLAQIPRADVVVVNPTHVAVALRYQAAEMPAPQVVAKGADVLAGRIRELARKHHIPIVHNPPLARALYAEVKVNRVVPGELYAAVAEVLAHVYRLRGRLS